MRTHAAKVWHGRKLPNGNFAEVYVEKQRIVQRHILHHLPYVDGVDVNRPDVDISAVCAKSVVQRLVYALPLGGKQIVVVLVNFHFLP